MTKHTQAVSLLRTWLDACKIPYEASPDDLSINGQKVSFNPANVMSTDMSVAMQEFHGITQAAGFGTPTPVDRGAAPVKKRLFKDNILARWRHSEMRTVPNSSTDVLAPFIPIAKREANTFFSRNRYICSAMGYDLEVAHNDALVWTNTFIGRYRIRLDDPEQEERENKKLLTNYLRQRFQEMLRGLKRERRNVVPDEAWFHDQTEMGEEPTEEWKEAHDEIGYKSAQLRRARVKDLLSENFAKLGHDGMIEALQRTSQEHPCIDTRHAATRYLREHSEGCEACLKAQTKE